MMSQKYSNDYPFLYVGGPISIIILQWNNIPLAGFHTEGGPGIPPPAIFHPQKSLNLVWCLVKLDNATAKDIIIVAEPISS